MILQYLAEISPKSPPPGHVAHSMQLIMRPLKKLGISSQPHAVLGYCTLTQSDILIETDVSYTDISSLPSSVCSAGDMLRPEDQSKDYEMAIGGMTLDSASSMGMEERRVKDMEKEPAVEEKKGQTDME